MAYPPPPIPQDALPAQPIRIRVDNLPPAKNWRQIKSFLSQFIPYEQVLNVKVLPLMPSMAPPFIPLQSCIVLLRQDTDWPHLLVQLNGVQWDYHTMVALLLPNFIPPDSPQLLAGAVAPVGAAAGPVSSSPSGSSNGSSTNNHRFGHHNHHYHSQHYSQQQQQHSQQEHGHQDRQTHGLRMALHPQFTPGVPTLVPNGHAQHLNRRLTQIFNEATFRRQMSQRNMYQLQLSNFPPCLHWDEVVKTTGDTSLSFDQQPFSGKSADGSCEASASPSQPHQQQKYHNSEQQQHPQQMTALIPQPHVLQDENNEIVPDLTIMTPHPEKFGKLKWTILKDFIKLKCPKLLEIDHKTQGTALSNTREFYVGVYEDSESHVEIILLPGDKPDRIIGGPLSEQQTLEMVGDEPKRFKVRATLFQAVIGFHSKELCDLCFDSIDGEEYMLGYKLQVQKLPKLSG
ncbi:uncharacterized protein Ecym_4330 [Eremothecium cymbalariae DBVPG|uniref:RRM domain-containing protein n=1 Tax=Eremothecium cymbalariae (strain CBS 270.75 / DBVPG 7215 / KCTC 17166 / NRRL Y-17582) TaxID=931890 RepID=G8JTN9_ERECY|nr:hypothetical protein Ecym_4330 [Eremothecium cymbalariae DBVPG\